MRTTSCGTEFDLPHTAPAPKRRVSIALRMVSVWHAFRNRIASNRLYELDDHQLDDIGITRHDVIKAMERSGVLDDPSLMLSHAARERSRTRFLRPARR